jgi:hypothetical protein
MMVIFESYGAPLMALHGLAAYLMIMLFSYSYYFLYRAHKTGRYKKLDYEKRVARTGYLLYLFHFLLGAMIYPAFRIYVRAAYFDTELKAGTGLFEIKEHLAFFTLLLYTAYMALGRADFRRDPAMFRPYFALATMGLVSVWILGILGFTIATLKSLGVMLP